jgi:hypothetical protein
MPLNAGLEDTFPQKVGLFLTDGADYLEDLAEARLDTNSLAGKLTLGLVKTVACPGRGVGDTLQFGRDTGDAIFSNPGDWLDRLAAAGDDMTRLGTMLNFAATSLRGLQASMDAGGKTPPPPPGITDEQSPAPRRDVPGKKIVKKNGVAVKHHGTNDVDKPAHAHVTGGGRETRIGPNGKPPKRPT